MFHAQGPSLLELARQALSSTEEGYDLLASKFELTPFRTPEVLLKPLFAHVFEAGPVSTALDVACGTGALLRHLGPFVRERLVGVDFSQGMLDEAKKRLDGLEHLTLLRADARALAFHEEFELVTSAGAFGHFVGQDEDALLDGIRRALVPGGRFVFPTTRRPHVLSPAFWVARAFNAAMHVRNALRQPPFVMLSLTFTWPQASGSLARHGFQVSAREDLFPGSRSKVVAVTARKR